MNNLAATLLNLEGKKITLSTLKSFVKANRDSLLINVKGRFDGMIDGYAERHGGFQPVKEIVTEGRPFHVASMQEATLGIEGVWLVRGSRDYFRHYNENGYEGILVDNCCGRFILAVKK